MNFLALFPGSIWVYVGMVLVCLGTGGAGGYYARGVIDAPVISAAKLETSQCAAKTETDRANGNQKVIDALSGGVTDLNAALERAAQQDAARKAGDANFLKELANAPKSSICGSSAAERAYRNSVRAQTPP